MACLPGRRWAIISNNAGILIIRILGTNFSEVLREIHRFSFKKNAIFITSRPRQNGCHFADDAFKCIYLNGNFRILIKISLKFVPKGPINNVPALVQIMAWHRPGEKPSSEQMMVRLSMHICVTLPQWVKLPSLKWWQFCLARCVKPSFYRSWSRTRSNTALSICRRVDRWMEEGRVLSITTRQIRTPVLRIPPAVTSQAKMKNWLHECQKWVSHMIGHYAHI